MKNIIMILLVAVLSINLFEYQYNRINDKASKGIDGYKTLSQLDKDVQCLAQNLQMEAGQEPIEGKLAVAIVTMNRVKSGKWGKSICEVVYAKNQFSWTIDNPKNRHNFIHRNMQEYRDSEEVAKRVILEKYNVKSLDGVLYYYADYIQKPAWASKMKMTCKIGRHIFYREV